MAEVVGFVASGVTIGTIAAQITSSIVKLKSYWNQVQNAPEDIHDMIYELKALNELLAVVEGSVLQNALPGPLFDPNSLSRCLQHCKIAARRLTELTDSLERDLQATNKFKHRWASAKVVMKKEKIERHEAKLDRTIRLLSFAYQLYTGAIMQSRTELILSKLSSVSSNSTALKTTANNELSTSNSNHDSRSTFSWSLDGLIGAFQYSRKHSVKLQRTYPDELERGEEVEYTVLQYRAPTWLLNRLWSIQAFHSSSGWTFSPRVHNVIPKEALILNYIEANDSHGIQTLFAGREASPYDCDVRGRSLLHYAMTYDAFAASKLLIEQGADVDFCDMDGISAVDKVSQPGFLHCRSWDERRLDLQRLLLHRSDSLPSIVDYGGPEEGFKVLQQSVDPMYYQRSPPERVETAIEAILHNSFTNIATPIEYILGSDIDLAWAYIYERNDGVTLLHSMAFALGIIVNGLVWSGNGRKCWSTEWRRQKKADIKAKRRQLRQALTLTPDKNHASLIDRTPLLELIGGFVIRRTSNNCDMSFLLEIWAEDVLACDIDLEEYGRVEHAYFEEHSDKLFFPSDTWDYTSHCWRETSSLTIASFRYGPLPSDWEIILKEVEEAYEIPGIVPGGWVEEGQNQDENHQQMAG